MDFVQTYLLDVIGGAFLFSLAFVEGSAWLLTKQRYKAHKIFVLASALSAITVYCVWHSDTAPFAMRPFAFLLFAIVVVAVPLVALTLVSFAVKNARHELVKQSGLIAAAIVVGAVWPFATIAALCGSGLDCF